jgi:hypothetical protein
MGIKGIDGMTRHQLQQALDDGARFVMYQYCISIGIMTFKRSSDAYFVPADGSRLKPGLIYTVLSLIAGWWGFPWGPIFTIQVVTRNLRGGLDVTDAVWDHLRPRVPRTAPAIA